MRMGYRRSELETVYDLLSPDYPDLPHGGRQLVVDTILMYFAQLSVTLCYRTETLRRQSGAGPPVRWLMICPCTASALTVWSCAVVAASFKEHKNT